MKSLSSLSTEAHQQQVQSTYADSMGASEHQGRRQPQQHSTTHLLPMFHGASRGQEIPPGACVCGEARGPFYFHRNMPEYRTSFSIYPPTQLTSCLFHVLGFHGNLSVEERVLVLSFINFF